MCWWCCKKWRQKICKSKSINFPKVEGDLQRAEERANAGENKIVDLEEELKLIGENLKALEVAEEKAQQREEEYKKQIRLLTDRLKSAESRWVKIFLCSLFVLML